jgi:nucleoside-triphosphatase
VIRGTLSRFGKERCAGFYTEEVRQGGRRIGFDVVTLDGRRAPLARAGAPGPGVSRYGVDVAAFEALGVAVLESALTTPHRPLVIDEIGKMELFSERFIVALEKIFDPASPHAVLGTIMRGRHPITDKIRRSPQVRVIEVTRENRDSLPDRLAARLSEEGRG